MFSLHFWVCVEFSLINGYNNEKYSHKLSVRLREQLRSRKEPKLYHFKIVWFFVEIKVSQLTF